MDSPDPAVRERVARDVVILQNAGLRPVVVHGGGKAITRAMERAGLKAFFVQGMRVTDEPAVQIVEQTLSREINPEIVASIDRLGGKARGFSGSEIFSCRKLLPSDSAGAGADLGFVGDVTAVRADRLHEVLQAGFIPVISPTATGPEGKLYNCNADVAAAQTAIALRAARLIFMSDVPGLLRDPQTPGSLINEINAVEIETLKKTGVIDKGMIPKVDSAVAAARSGVRSVSFIDGRAPHAILLEMFSRPSGTRVVS